MGQKYPSPGYTLLQKEAFPSSYYVFQANTWGKSCVRSRSSKKKTAKMNVNKQINTYPTCCRRDDGR